MDRNRQRELEKKHKIPPGWLANGQLANHLSNACFEWAVEKVQREGGDLEAHYVAQYRKQEKIHDTQYKRRRGPSRSAYYHAVVHLAHRMAVEKGIVVPPCTRFDETEIPELREIWEQVCRAYAEVTNNHPNELTKGKK